MINKFIAFKGEKFTIEWYFDIRFRSSALDYFNKLTAERQKKTLNLLRLLANLGKIFNEEKFRYEGDQIFAIKPSPDRFLCFFYEGSKIVITNAYEKKTAKMPMKEKERALKAKIDYTKRFQDGIYYE